MTGSPAVDKSNVDRVRTATAAVCSDVLAPTAADSDRFGVPRAHLDALAGAGATTAVAARWSGNELGTGWRELIELVSGACGTTWFCFAQHAAPTAAVLNSENEELCATWGPRLADGRALSGIAFAHVRRPGPPKVSVEPVGEDWIINGHLDWVTSWTICDVAMLVLAEAADPDRLVGLLIEPPRPDPANAPGLSAGPTLPLAAMGGTHTWPVDFDDYRVAGANVVFRMARDDYLAVDRLRVVDANPAVFGLIHAAVTGLAEVAGQRGQDEGIRAAQLLAGRLAQLRAEAYGRADEAAADPDVAETTLMLRADLRAQAHALALAAAQAVVLATSGAAVMLTSPGQRWLREAMFHLVQAQTPAVRDAGSRLIQHP